MLYCIAVAILFSLGSSQHIHMSTHEIAQHVDQAFNKLDVSPHDGILEENELSKVFYLRDEDHDNSLSKAEFEKHASNTPIRDKLFEMFDTDNNGGLGKTEFVTHNIAQMDHDNDNIVTRHEFDVFYTKFVHDALKAIQHGNHVDHGNHGHHS